ncbi:DUF3768 domain-containing protein [Sphingomonas yunnanensis]|nr:DUF3768 domain-containing protein [Sphingomonas yunnanensis]
MFALAPEALPIILKLVQAFDAFTPENDPLSEHRFAALGLQGKRLPCTPSAWRVNRSRIRSLPTAPSRKRRPQPLDLLVRRPKQVAHPGLRATPESDRDARIDEF